MRCTTIASLRSKFLACGSAHLIAVAAIATAFPAHAANVYWSGNASTQGGSGTWDTTNAHFGTAGAGPYTITWNNTTNASDVVIFGGGAGTVTLGANITIKQLTFNTNYQTVAGGSGPYTLNISGTNLSVGCGGAARGSNPGGIISAAIAGTGALTSYGVNGPLVLTGSNTYTGQTIVSNLGDTQSGVRMNLGNGGTAGSIGSSSGISVQNTSIFCTNRSDTITQGTHFPAISGLGSFIKAGSGTTILTAANTYSGTTAVTNGTLLVNGTIGPGAVTVSAGTLGGSGKVSGTATIGGTLSPGATTGVFTLGSLVLSSTSTSLIELPTAGTRGTDYDGISVLNASGLTYGGTMSMIFGSSLLPENTSFSIFSFTGSPAGSFAAVASTGYYAGTWTNNSDGTYSLAQDGQTLTFTQGTGILSVIGVPEPASLAITGLGIAFAATVAARRRAVRG